MNLKMNFGVKLINFIKNHKVIVKNKYVLLALLIILIGAITTAWVNTTAQTDNFPAEIGKKAPNFTLNDFNGNQVTLSDLQGKPIVIEFWDLNCSHCLTQLQILEKVRSDFPEIVFWGIHRSNIESKKRADFLNTHHFKIDFSLLSDTDGRVFDLYKFNDSKLPMTYFIDKNGVITNRLTGQLTEDLVRNTLSDLVSH